VKQSITEPEAEDFLEDASREVERAKISDKPDRVDLAGEFAESHRQSPGWLQEPPRLPPAGGDQQTAPPEAESDEENQESRQ